MKSMKDFLQKKDKSGKPKLSNEEVDTQLAAATLMFDVVRSDAEVSPLELLHVQEIVRQQFDLSGPELKEFQKLALAESKGNISIEECAAKIKSSWNGTKRIQLVERLWVIALADNIVDEKEAQIVRKIAALMNLNDVQIEDTYEGAMRHLGMDVFD